MARDIVVDVQVGGVGATADANTPAAASPSVVPTGQTGAYSTFEIVETVTGEAGTEAKAENLGTKTAVKLKLTIPRGGKGDQGESAYEAAKKEGYTGTKEEFGKEWATIKSAAQKVEKDAEAARESAQNAASSESNASNSAKNAQTSAESAASSAQAAVNAKAGAETAAQNAAGSSNAAAESAARAENAEAGAESAKAAAQAAQKAAEDARDSASEIVGGDFASKVEAQGYAKTAESNANKYTDQKIAAIPTPDVSGQINEHNSSGGAHSDIRLYIAGLTERLNALANSDDTTLDQMAEVVEYIKDNRELIEQITTGKVSVSDIVDNLTTNVTNKPLSAAQGVALKALVEAAAAAAAAAQSTANGKATMSEVNAAISDAIKKIPTPDVSGQINTHNQSTEAHPAIQQRLEVLENKGGGNSNITFATEEPTEEDGADGELRLVYTPESETPALPDGYTELAYIESTGTQYIDTGFKPKFDTRIVMDVSDVANVDRFMFGAKTADGTVANQYALLIKNATTVRSDYFGTYASATIASIATRTTIDQAGAIFRGWGQTINGTSVSSGEVPYPMYIFSLNVAGASMYALGMRLYSCQIYDGTTLVRNFIPCMNASGEVGLYDLANGVFYANAGTGEFLAGVKKGKLPEGYTQVEYIEATGSQYIDTDFKPQYNSRVVADISDLANVSGFVFGTRNSASAGQFAAYRANATIFRSDYFATQQSTTLADSTARTTIDKNGNVLTAYGLTITNTAVSSGGCNYPLFLFALNSTGSPLVFASYKLYSCQIYDNVALVRDYTPCINPSGVVGLYDLVNGVFYADAAGGTFTAGDAIEIKAPGKESDDSGEGYFKVDGKWYKLLPAALTAAEIRAICI